MVRSEEKVCAEETQMNLLHLLKMCSVTVIKKCTEKSGKWAKKREKIKKLINRNYATKMQIIDKYDVKTTEKGYK